MLLQHCVAVMLVILSFTGQGYRRDSAQNLQIDSGSS